MSKETAEQRLVELAGRLRSYLEGSKDPVATTKTSGDESAQETERRDGAAETITTLGKIFDVVKGTPKDALASQYLAGVLAKNWDFIASISDNNLKESIQNFIADFLPDNQQGQESERIRVRIDIDRKKSAASSRSVFKSILGSILISLAGSATYDIARAYVPTTETRADAEKNRDTWDIVENTGAMPIDYAVVNANEVRLRSAPSMHAKILRHLQHGTRLLRHQIDGDWVMVSVLDEGIGEVGVGIGWVHADYLDIVAGYSLLEPLSQLN